MISMLIMISNGALLVYVPVICRHSYAESERNHENSRDKQQAGVTHVVALPLLFIWITSRRVFDLKKVKLFLDSIKHKYIYLFYFIMGVWGGVVVKALRY